MTTRKANDTTDIRPDYRHAIPVLVLVVIGVTAALIARTYFVPETFGELVFYRAAAIEEEKARQPRHVGRAVCAGCHDEIAAIHAKDAHASVECESFHGPAWKHVEKPEAE